MTALARRLGWSALRLPGRVGLDLHPIATPRHRLAGFRLQWTHDDPSTLRCIVVNATVARQRVTFFVVNEFDIIQRVHLQGRFYEQEELDLIASRFNGGVFVDIGANVGNHVLYAARILGASKVIAFEPNPAALRVLELNVAGNGLQDRVVLHALGLADRAGWASLSTPNENNLGGTRLSPHAGDKDGARHKAGDDVDKAGDGGNGSSDGDRGLRLVRGDDVLAREQVDFIKIDTEGLELSVLLGLAETIGRCRPVMFVEVDDRNIPAFAAFCAGARYETAATFKRYPGNTNFLVTPLA